jgi:uncharacterized protein
MTLTSRLVGRLARLPPPRTRDVAIEEDLQVPMADGVTLLADRFHARPGGAAPIVLVRSPYGRKRAVGLLGRLLAERGYQVVIQSCRGTFGSGGEFDAFRNEAADGRATLDWIAAQPWFSGSVGMFGPSYVGLVQWAVAAGGPPHLRALAPSITASEFRSLLYPGGGFALDSTLTWLSQLAHQEEPGWRVPLNQLTQRRRLRPALAHLPLCEADALAAGGRVRFFQDWLVHDRPGDAWWDEVDFGRNPGAVAPAVTLVAGWYDLFAPAQLRDYRALRDAGRPVRLVVGPWTHVAPANLAAAIREALAWFDVHLRGDPAPASPPVRVFVMGAKEWRDLDDWPPPYTATRWHLQPGGALAEPAPGDSAPDRYRYDPADPTPAVGGIVLGSHAGPRDNRKVEARADVLTYTTPPLDARLEVIGPVEAELFLRSSLEHTDLFVRLCDVHPSGRSINVCDGLTRLAPGTWSRGDDGVACVRVELWPTAHRFLHGHRVRVQVSSGAHPRFARNLGSGEPLATGVRLVAADQEVLHDPAHPSAVILPAVPERISLPPGGGGSGWGGWITKQP